MRILAFFIASILIFSSCKNEKVQEPEPVVEYLKVTLQPTFGISDLQLDQTITTSEGYKVQFTDIKCYFTSVKNASKEVCKSALYDFRENGTIIFKKAGKPSEYSNLSSYLGVDVQYNHSDPSAFENEDPLNIMIANDMHWDWNPGYIFLKIEAKVDTLNDGFDNFNHFVIFHIGADSFIQSLPFTEINWVASEANTYTLPLKVDLQKFLQNGSQTIDLKTEYTSHSASGQEALSLKVIENFKDAISTY